MKDEVWGLGCGSPPLSRRREAMRLIEHAMRGEALRPKVTDAEGNETEYQFFSKRVRWRR